MPVPFGVSVGDFIAVGGLVVRIYQSLDDASYDAAMFEEAQRELVSFHIALMGVEQCLNSGAVLVDDDARRLKMVLDSCQKPMEDFQARVQKYKSSGNDKPRASGIASWRRQLAWSIGGKKCVEPFRQAIRSYSASLLVVQAVIHQQSLTRMEQAIDEPWDTSPIRFQDATGRRYPVPLEVCNTFKDMLAFINFALPDFGEAKAIEQDEIWLFSPARGHTKRWNLIGEEDWEVATYPGMRLGMSMNDVTNRCEELSSAATDGATSGAPILALGNKAPWRVETPRILAGATLASASDDVGPALHRSNHCAGSSSPSSAVPEAPVVVQFSTPLPEWSTYPEDAEFRFL